MCECACVYCKCKPEVSAIIGSGVMCWSLKFVTLTEQRIGSKCIGMLWKRQDIRIYCLKWIWHSCLFQKLLSVFGTVWYALHRHFDMVFFCVVFEVWNNLRLCKWWPNFIFGWTIPLTNLVINDHTVFLYFKTVAPAGTVQPLSLKKTLWIHYRINGTSVKILQQQVILDIIRSRIELSFPMPDSDI